MVTLVFRCLSYSFRNQYFTEECFNTFVDKTFTVIIFYKKVFNFSNTLMEFRHVSAYVKTAEDNCRNQIELVIEEHVTTKMRVNITKSGFTVNRDGRTIVFSDNFHI